MKKEFIEGFVKAMKDISDNNIDETITKSTLNYLKCVRDGVWAKSPSDYGYVAGIDHFNGNHTRDTDYAAEIGLVRLYDGFWGQSNWSHPDLDA